MKKRCRLENKQNLGERYKINKINKHEYKLNTNKKKLKIFLQFQEKVINIKSIDIIKIKIQINANINQYKYQKIKSIQLTKMICNDYTDQQKNIFENMPQVS